MPAAGTADTPVAGTAHDKAGHGNTGRDVPALTGVRAVACVWVMLSHVAQGFTPALPGWLPTLMLPGYLGVDLFYILSGFILALVHSRLQLRAAAIGGFLVKRVFRVYPLSAAIMLFMAADAGWNGWIGPGWFDPRHFLPYLLMIEAFYTDPPILGWLATNWSVGIELICYALFPFLVTIMRRLPRPWLTLALLGLIVAEGLTQRGHLAQYYGLGAVLRGVCGFGLGAAAAFVTRSYPRPPQAAIAAAELVSLIVIGWLLLAPLLWPIPLAMAVLIASLSYGGGAVAALLAARVPVWLGDISYSLYLVHGVILGRWSWSWLAALRSVLPDPAASVVWLACFLGATVGVSAVTYAVIEYPGRRFGRVIASRLAASRAAQTPLGDAVKG